MEGTLRAVPFEADALVVIGDPVEVIEGVRMLGLGAADFALSQDGSLVYVTGEGRRGLSSQLLVVDLNGNEDPLDLAPRNLLNVRWSPNGQSVVSRSDGQRHIYSVTLGTTPRQLTFEGQNNCPVFSPDGTRLAFASNREGTLDYDLFLKNLSDDLPPISAPTLDGDIAVRCRGRERQPIHDLCLCNWLGSPLHTL